MVLGQGVLRAVVAVNLDNAVVVVAQIRLRVRRDIGVQIQQNVSGHVLFRLIDVHPEHIRQFSSGSAGFQQRPVGVPADDVHFDVHTGLGGPFVRDLLQSGLLVGVPDVHNQGIRLVAARRFGGVLAVVRVLYYGGLLLRAAAGNQEKGHCQRKQQRHALLSIHSDSSLLVPRRFRLIHWGKYNPESQEVVWHTAYKI